MRAVRRGRRAGHAGKGRPGTWETFPSPPLGGGPGAAVEVAQAPEQRPGSGERTGQSVVPPSEGNEARRDGRGGVGVR